MPPRPPLLPLHLLSALCVFNKPKSLQDGHSRALLRGVCWPGTALARRALSARLTAVRTGLLIFPTLPPAPMSADPLRRRINV